MCTHLREDGDLGGAVPPVGAVDEHRAAVGVEAVGAAVRAEQEGREVLEPRRVVEGAQVRGSARPRVQLVQLEVRRAHLPTGGAEGWGQHV